MFHVANAIIPPTTPFRFKMDQQFADMLADRPADSKKRDHHHGKEQKHGGKKHVEDAALGHPHEHERLGAQSVGVELAEGPIDWAKFTSWLKGFLEKEGELIWRLKGVLWTTAPGGEYSSTPAWGLGSGKRTVVQVGTNGEKNRLEGHVLRPPPQLVRFQLFLKDTASDREDLWRCFFLNKHSHCDLRYITPPPLFII